MLERKFMNTKYKNIMISLMVGILVFCGGALRIYMDDTIQLRVIYRFFNEVKQECFLRIDCGDSVYNLEPRFPMEDTYAAGWYEVEYEIPKKIVNIDSFSVELAHEDDTAKVRSIEFYDHSVQAAKYSPEDIGILFEAEDSTSSIDYEQINITSPNDVIILNGTDKFIYEYDKIQKCDITVWINCIVLAVILIFFCHYILIRVDRMKRSENVKTDLTKEDAMWAAVLMSIFAVCILMSFGSKHYAHADEYVTRAAIDYYLGGYFPPASMSHWQAGTRSLHGFSRLNETTLYYLFAGKIGWIFREFCHIRVYYRMTGLILLAIMLLICWKRRRRNKFLFLTLCITPQIWYLFSYATSDQWDWFWSFWILIITLDRDSILYRAIEKRRRSKQNCIYMALCAVLFAQMFLGKDNYLIVLALPFINLMIYWIHDVKRNLRVFLHCFLILMLTLGIYEGVKNIPRVGAPYSIEMTAEDMQSSLDDRNILIDTAYEYESNAPAEQGVTFWNMLWNYTYMPTPALLFTSAIGYYVWSSLWGGKLYSMIMLLLYIGIGAGLLTSIVREREWEARLKIALSVLLIAASISAALLYCYCVTYQPQGRYILPVFLILGFATAYAEYFTRSRYYKWLVLACYIAGLWCFGYAGLYTMYQNGILVI